MDYIETRRHFGLIINHRKWTILSLFSHRYQCFHICINLAISLQRQNSRTLKFAVLYKYKLSISTQIFRGIPHVFVVQFIRKKSTLVLFFALGAPLRLVMPFLLIDYGYYARFLCEEDSILVISTISRDKRLHPQNECDNPHKK